MLLNRLCFFDDGKGEEMRKDAVVFETLKQIGAFLQKGHFQYYDGRHGEDYVNHRAIFQNPKAARFISLSLAERFERNLFDVVIGPRNGGASLAEHVAQHLTFLWGKNIMPLGAEKICTQCSGKGFFLEEDTIEQIRGKRVLVVDDVGNSGRSVNNVIRLTKEAGSIVAAVGYICNRGGLEKTAFGITDHYVCLLDFPLESWDPSNGECKLCLDGVPLNTRFGHGTDLTKQLFLPFS